MPERTEQEIVRHMIDVHQEALEDEFGKFTLVNAEDPEKVLLIPEEADSREGWMACYRSDKSADARLLVDDYVPELAE